MKQRWIFLSVLVVLTLAPTIDLALNYLNHFNGSYSRIIWERTGGLMGLNEKLIIEFDGSVLYTSSHYYGTTNGIAIADYVITPADLDDLLDKIGFFTKDEIYKSKSNVADYFVYKLIVGTTSNPLIVEWVDAWASKEALPPELLDLQGQMLGIIEILL